MIFQNYLSVISSYFALFFIVFSAPFDFVFRLKDSLLGALVQALLGLCGPSLLMLHVLLYVICIKLYNTTL